MKIEKEGLLIRDSFTMFIRSLKLSFRNPGAVGVAILAPASIMAIFVYVFGGALNVGDYSVVNFIVPGTILLSIGQSAPIISVRINNDMTKGVIDRYRTMPIAKSSILVGHVLATTIQSVVTVIASIGIALLIGFKPQAGLIEWFMVSGIMVLYITMLVWMATWCGVYAQSAEGSASFMTILGLLPFLSSGFVPTETMPGPLRIFAENQPMTPIINSVRALLLNQPLPDGTIRTALLWCVGLGFVFCIAALQIYKRKTAV